MTGAKKITPTRRQREVLKLLAAGCWLRKYDYSRIIGIHHLDDRPWRNRGELRAKTVAALRENAWIDQQWALTEEGRRWT
jgi:hypothetical protein